MKLNPLLLFAFLLLISCNTGTGPDLESVKEGITTDRKTISAEMEQVLEEGMMKNWYPRCLDTIYGGFLSNFDHRWNPLERQPKFIVTQARHTWTAARMFRWDPGNELYLNASSHGFDFLRDRMWDKEYGGFHTMTDREGNPVVNEQAGTTKTAYGNAFAIYGLAAYFQVSRDSAALDLAVRAFSWLDTHSHDPEFGGYFQFMERSGTPLTEGHRGTPPKDQNSSIHLMEAFTELYQVWKNELLRSRIEEMLVLIRDTITTQKGYMNLFFRKDWSPVYYTDETFPGGENPYLFDYISFGHDIETAFLLLEASRALGHETDEKTLQVSKRMTDHALERGWDPETGALFDAGYYFPGDHEVTILDSATAWWSAVEAFHTMLLMSTLHPSDPMEYYDRFTLTWDYCKRYLIDHENGGWYRTGTNYEPEAVDGSKAGVWKGNYHTARSLIRCMRILNLPGADPEEPVNPEATPEARALLGYLHHISGDSILSGHQNYNRDLTRWHLYVEELTGKSPAVWGSDLSRYYQEGNPEALVEEAIRRHREGYVVTLMWHTGRPQDSPPFDWATSTQGDMMEQEWRELITPGTALHAKWQERVDSVAIYLKQLRDQNVPVLWRPYHEMNGIWFWWGDKKGEEGFAALWKMMYDRYVNHHQLHNLVWVWNANAPRDRKDDEAYAYEFYFPGLEYVDVLATDVYHNDYRQEHHDQLLEMAHGKVIALGEVGEMPTPEILDRQPMWTWFMVWTGWVETHNTPEKVKALYAYPRTLSHGEFRIKYEK